MFTPERKWHCSMQSRTSRWPARHHKKMVRFLELCVSSLRRGHANLLCIVPNFVNVFGFPLGRECGYPLLYMPHRARKLTVRGPQLEKVAQACSRCALGISQELRNTQRRCGCSILASVRVRGAGDPGTWRGTCPQQRCQSGHRLLSTHHASDLIHQSMAIDLAIHIRKPHRQRTGEDPLYHVVVALRATESTILMSLSNSVLPSLIMNDVH